MSLAKPARAKTVDVVSEGHIVHYFAHVDGFPCRAGLVIKMVRQRGPLVETGIDAAGETVYAPPTWTKQDNGAALLQVFYAPEDLAHVIGSLTAGTKQLIALHGQDVTQWHAIGECPNA